jgi:methyl-accepting chemotaxis protein
MEATNQPSNPSSEKAINIDVIKLVSTLPSAAMVIDASGKVLATNQAMVEIVGIPIAVSMGMRVRDYLGGAIGKDGCPVIGALTSGKAIRIEEMEVVPASRKALPVSMTATPLLDDNGKVEGGLLLLGPTASSKEKDERLFLYEHILDALPWPLSVTDMDMNITFVNQASLKILKRTRQDLVGKNCTEWNGAVCRTKNCGIMQLRNGTEHTTSERDGKTTQIDVSYLKNEKGENFGHLEIIQDITARRKEAEYRKAWFQQVGENLKSLAAGDMNLQLDLAKPDQYTQHLYDMYSATNANLGRVRDSIKALIADADLLSNAAIHGALDVRADASKHLGGYAQVVSGVNRTLDAVMRTFEAIPAPIMFLDKDLRIQYINNAGAKIRGKTKAELMGIPCTKVSKTLRCGNSGCPCTEAMRTKSVVTCDNESGTGDRHRDIFCVGAPLTDEKGEVVGSFEFVTDQTLVKNAVRKSQKVAEYQSQAVITINGVLQELASGDLTSMAELDAPDGDTKEAYEAFNALHGAIGEFKDAVVDLLREVNASVETVSSTSEELASSAEEMNASTEQVSAAIQQISKGAQNQAAQVEETAIIMADMSSSVVEVVNKSAVAVQAAGKANDSALTGKTAVENTVKKVEELSRVVDESAKVIEILGKRSEEIGEIVGVITGISDQTNLLALNAAIEAARAGEQGRGFAVVAEEVKNLAEDSREAAERIAKMIKEVQQETSRAVEAMQRGTKTAAEGMEMVNETGKAFQDISKMAAATSAEVTMISTLMEKQIISQQKAAKSVDGISAIAEETASASEESASSTEELTASMEDMTARAQSLSEMAINLKRVAGAFKIDEDGSAVEQQAPASKGRYAAQPTTRNQSTNAAVPAKVKMALNKRGLSVPRK